MTIPRDIGALRVRVGIHLYVTKVTRSEATATPRLSTARPMAKERGRVRLKDDIVDAYKRAMVTEDRLP